MDINRSARRRIKTLEKQEVNPSIIIATAFAAMFKPRQKVGDWIRDQRVPMHENRTYRGQHYEFDSRAPFLSALIYDFIHDKSARELINMKDSQSMHTTMVMFSVAWMLTNDPGNVIWVTNTRDKVREFGRDRMAPIFDAIPGLGKNDRREEHVDSQETGAAKKKSTSTAMAWRFPGGVLYLGGGHTVAALVSTPAAWVVLDEVSKHPMPNDMSTIDLGRSRVTGDDDSKIFAFSTPEHEVDYVLDPSTGLEKPVIVPGNVQHSEFLSGTQEYCEVSCPHCGTWQDLVFEQLKFDHCVVRDNPDDKGRWDFARVEAETWYQCVNKECVDPATGEQGRIDERWKSHFTKNFRWRARNPHHTPGRRSASISALYNVANVNRSWGKIAMAFLDAKRKGSQAAMKSFWTDFLGLPFKTGRIAGAAIRQVMNLCGLWRSLGPDNKPNKVLPWTAAEMKFVGMICDVQLDRLKWVICAFAKDGRIHLLDWSDDNENLQLRDVPDLAYAREWESAPDETGGSAEYVISTVFIDTGYQTNEVYRLLAGQMSRPGNMIHWEGVHGMHESKSKRAQLTKWWIEHYPVEDAVTHLPTGHEAAVNCINAETWEEDLYAERIKNHDPANPREDFPAIILPHDMKNDDPFFAEMCNMKKDWKKDKRGRTRIQWQKVNSGPNDFGDLMKYALVMEYSWRVRDTGET